MKTNRLLSLLSLLFLYSISNAQDSCPPEIGTNLGEFRTALVDIFKSSRTFWETDLDDFIWDTENGLSLDANGYPTSINVSEGRAARTLVWEALEGNYPTGIYTLLYDGEGSIEVGMDAINPVFTDNGGTDNRIIFEVTTTTNEGIMVDITATTVGNHVHNIRIIRPNEGSADYVNSYATEPFIDLFYERHKYFKSIRFMDWMTTNWSIYSSWLDRPTWEKSTWAIHEAGPGVPVEVMVHVANRLQAHPWFCMPHRADDNYMTQFATYVRDNLNPNLKVSIEYSNEVWNGLFSSYDDFNGQHDYALEMGTTNGIEGYFERIGYWVGRRSAEMFDIFDTVFGGNERLVKVIPIQTGPDLATPHTLDYVHNGTPVHQMGDVVAGAVYFGGEYENDDLTNMTVTELLNHMAANMYNFDSGPYWCLQTIDMLNNATYQDSELEFVAYEGGQHLANFAGTPEDNATATLIAANRHVQMGNIYSDFYDWWATTGAGTFMAFTSVGEPSMFGAWGLLENIEQDTLTAPKWLATTNWIRDNQCNTTNGDCQATLLLNDNPIAGGIYQSSNTITSAGVVAAGTSVTLDARNEITLNPNFTAAATSTFTARIGGCMANTIAEEDSTFKGINQLITSTTTTEFSKDFNFSLYPSPATGEVILDFHLEQASEAVITLHSTTGNILKVIRKNTILNNGSHQFIVNATSLPSGLYYVVISTPFVQKSQKLMVHRN